MRRPVLVMGTMSQQQVPSVSPPRRDGTSPPPPTNGSPPPPSSDHTSPNLVPTNEPLLDDEDKSMEDITPPLVGGDSVTTGSTEILPTVAVRLARCQPKDFRIQCPGFPLLFCVGPGETARISLEVSCSSKLSGMLVSQPEQFSLLLVPSAGGNAAANGAPPSTNNFSSKLRFTYRDTAFESEQKLVHSHRIDRFRISLLFSRNSITIRCNDKTFLDLKRADLDEASSTDRGDGDMRNSQPSIPGTVLEIGKHLTGTVHSATFVKQGDTILRLSTKDGDCIVETIAAAHNDTKSPLKVSQPGTKRRIVFSIGKNAVTLLLAFALAALAWYSISTAIGIYTRSTVPKPVLDQGMEELHRKLARLSMLAESKKNHPGTAEILSELGRTIQKSRDFIQEQRKQIG
jgi:hypothetical protein